MLRESLYNKTDQAFFTVVFTVFSGKAGRAVEACATVLVDIGPLLLS